MNKYEGIVSARLKKIRLEKGYAEEEISKILNIEVKTYSHFETGKYFMCAEEILKLCLFYNVSVDYLLGRNDDESPLSQTEIENIKFLIAEYAARPRRRRR